VFAAGFETGSNRQEVRDVGKAGNYRYGLYLNPQPGDPVVDFREAAEAKARQMSLANNGTPVAVWDSSDRTIKLFAGFEVFEPVRH
jgi:hypothetical protein